MAVQVSAFIYGQNNNDWGLGLEMGFPASMIVAIPLIPPVTFLTATVNSKIKVLGGDEPYLTAPEFYTDKTVAQIVSDSNA